MVTTVCELTGLVAILKLGDVLAPAATRTDAGGVATEGLELDNKMVKPPTGAGAFSVTLPPTVLPPITPVWVSVTVEGAGGSTISVAVAAMPL